MMQNTRPRLGFVRERVVGVVSVTDLLDLMAGEAGGR